MLYSFHQYETIIQGTLLEGIIDNDRTLLADAERMARDLVNTKLATRYNLSTALQDLMVFDPLAIYAANAVVTDATLAPIYYALLDVPPNTPLTDPVYWANGDPRYAYLRKIIMDIVLYELHKRVSAQHIPEIRLLEYKNAIAWLNEARDGLITLPFPPGANSGNNGNSGSGTNNLIEFGSSSPYQDNYW